MGEFIGKELQGDVAAELKVFRLVHHAHAPATDLAEDAVMRNRLPWGLGWRGHWLDMLGGVKGKVNVRVFVLLSHGLSATLETLVCRLEVR